MSNPQTEARAFRAVDETGDFVMSIDDIATALAAKDAAYDEAVFLKDCAEAALLKREAELVAKDAELAAEREKFQHFQDLAAAHRAELEAQLAEANKALDTLAAPPSPIQKLGAAISRRDWHEAEQAHEIIRDIIDAARRVREGGKS